MDGDRPPFFVQVEHTDIYSCALEFVSGSPEDTHNPLGSM